MKPITALSGPLVDTLGIEFHEEDVFKARSARMIVSIKGAIRVSSHPGIAIGIHLHAAQVPSPGGVSSRTCGHDPALHKDRRLSFAVLHRCT